MDEATAGSLRDPGMTINLQCTNHLTQADGLVISDEKTDRLEERLAALTTSGMSICAQKSVGLILQKD